MTLRLYFVPSLFPRTIGRKAWREIYRWKRVTEKRLEAEVSKQMQDFATFGSTMPEHMRRDFMDRLINPPLLVHDQQAITQDQIHALSR